MNFASDISVFWLIPWAIISVLLALWLYKGSSWTKEISKKWRITLTTLRALSLFLIGLLLIGIIFQAFNYRTEKPVLVIGVDTSSSMKNYKDSLKIKGQINQLIAKATETLGEKFDIVAYEFGSELKSLDTVRFPQKKTDLAASFEQLYADYYNRNLGAVLFVSDGNFNQGNNPVYSAKKLIMTPIYSLGVGDTIYKRDHFVKNVAVNDVAFINNQFPVVIDIEGNKMGKTGANVTVELGGKIIASQRIQYEDGVSDFKQVTFLINATNIGFQQYTVRVDKQQNEYNYENNVRSFYVEVIDSRSKILIISDAPHPDIAALKSVFDTDQNLEVVFSSSSEWDRKLINVDLIVWHEAGRSCPKEVRDALLKNPISKLFIVGPNSDKNNVTALEIGLNVPNGNQTDDVEGVINTGFQQFEISEDVKKAMKYYPPLKSKFGQFSTSNGIDILSYQRIGAIQKKDAQIFFGKTNQYKYGVIYGEGLWRWKMAEYARSEGTNAFNELFSKTAQYLLVKQNSSPLRITLPKKFNGEENVIVNATFLNESLEPITTPTINFNLISEDKKVSKLQFGAVGKGYKLDLGQLPAGKYSWSASTKFNGKSYEKNGVFIVESQSIEQLDTRANHALMNQLATVTKGKFRRLDDFQKSINELKDRKDLTSIAYQESTFNDLIEYLWILILLLLLLGTEWFLRRWLGSY